MHANKPRVVIGLAAVGSILVAAVAAMLVGMRPPADLDVSTQLPTAQQRFNVAYTPSVSPPPINQLHTWTLQVTDARGQPVQGARIEVDGDMPQHGHGLPTRPQVTRELSAGTYLVEGMKFQMGGWWVVDVTINADGRSDSVRFNLSL